MKVRIVVMPKEEVLDPQGKAVEHSLKTLGFTEVTEVRVGRVVELTVRGSAPDAAARAERMCEDLLANPVIEQYRIEFL